MTNEEVEIIKMVFQSYLNIVKIFKKPNYISEEVITEVRDKLIKALEQQPCEDCISRAEVYDIITRLFTSTEMTNEIYKNTMQLIKDMPSVTPQRQKGRWIQQEDIHKHHYGWLYCSECGAFLMSSDGANYCSCCGAKMEVDE